MSEDIYDRSRWPAADCNPLVVMLERNDLWYTNTEMVRALGVESSRPKALISQWPTLLQQIGEDHTALVSRGWITPTGERGKQAGGQERCFSREALVVIGMRAQTPNAAAFRDWIAEDLWSEGRFARMAA